MNSRMNHNQRSLEVWGMLALGQLSPPITPSIPERCDTRLSIGTQTLINSFPYPPETETSGSGSRFSRAPIPVIDSYSYNQDPEVNSIFPTSAQSTRSSNKYDSEKQTVEGSVRYGTPATVAFTSREIDVAPEPVDLGNVDGSHGGGSAGVNNHQRSSTAGMKYVVGGAAGGGGGVEEGGQAGDTRKQGMRYWPLKTKCIIIGIVVFLVAISATIGGVVHLKLQQRQNYMESPQSSNTPSPTSTSYSTMNGTFTATPTSTQSTSKPTETADPNKEVFPIKRGISKLIAPYTASGNCTNNHPGNYYYVSTCYDMKSHIEVIPAGEKRWPLEVKGPDHEFLPGNLVYNSTELGWGEVGLQQGGFYGYHDVQRTEISNNKTGTSEKKIQVVVEMNFRLMKGNRWTFVKKHSVKARDIFGPILLLPDGDVPEYKTCWCHYYGILEAM
ncbi:hypothetical protein DFH27DRAFT_522275 [Peziza echinospora]|nr:hypothetical protein DFH27DRAFT_522275 [Peziza echinospora]